MQQLLLMVKSELQKIKCWFDIKKLSLNLSKTKFMIFVNRQIRQDVCLEIENVEIERVYEIKFLGVLIDHTLCWKPHIKYLCSKVSRSIGILGKTKHFLDNKSLQILYYALIDPFCRGMGKCIQNHCTKDLHFTKKSH